MQDPLSYKLEATGDARRDQAIATRTLSAGDLVLSTRPLATVLLPDQKGRRCDYCLRPLCSTLRCSDCKQYWYCDRQCQEKDWIGRHKRTCSLFKSSVWQSFARSLALLDLLDTILLFHLFAAHYPGLLELSETGEDPLSAPSLFLHLLPAVEGQCLGLPTIRKLMEFTSWELRLIKHACERFRNNNFEITSGLDGIAHGVFPPTSRSFNHSCSPTAIAVYSADADGLRQNVIAMRDIPIGQEITLPYLDPAMALSKRQAKLKAVYGFDCDCSLCRYQSRTTIPSVPLSGPLRETLEAELQSFGDHEPPTFLGDHTSLPSELLGAFNESFLSSITESFSRQSHEGPFVEAIRLGQVLRGCYKVIYPPCHPLIGYHDLELAKTVWNAIAQNEMPAQEDWFKSKARVYLRSAEAILDAVGRADEELRWVLEVDQLKVVLA